MSFYSVSNPSNFAVQNPSQQLAKQVQQLKNSFSQPFDVEISTSDQSVQYTAEQLLSRFITRKTDDYFVVDGFPAAVDIIAELNNNQWIKRDNQLQQDTPIQKGFTMDFAIFNDNTTDMVVVGNEGTIVNCPYENFSYLSSGACFNYRLNVVNTTPEQEQVIINQLTFCYGFMPGLALSQEQIAKFPAGMQQGMANLAKPQ
jgi:hypothetical protein